MTKRHEKRERATAAGQSADTRELDERALGGEPGEAAPGSGTRGEGAGDAERAGDEQAGGEGRPDDADATAPDLEAELEEARADRVRLLAEFQNFRKRSDRDRVRIRADVTCAIFSGLLPIIHDLERAREASTGDGGVESIAEGIDLVLRRLREFLRREGVGEVDPIGERFDAARMEAVGMMPSEEHESGCVAQVLQKGLVHGDRLIEPARVLVSSGPSATDAPGENAK